MKDEIAKIEDRLTELKKPIRFNNDDKDSDDSDDNGPPSGGAREREPPITVPVRPIPRPHPDKTDYQQLMDRLNKLRGKPTPPPRSCNIDEIDNYDALQEKLDKLRYDPPNPNLDRDKGDTNFGDQPHPYPSEFKLPDVLETPIIPSKPLIDTFARPITKIIDDQTQTIEITAKKPPIAENNLSEQLQEIFPDISQVNKTKNAQFNTEAQKLNKTLSEIGQADLVPFEFEFFSGGKSEKIAEYVRSLGASTDNLDFLDFLQSDLCKKILKDNKLKIHIETGNIYYNDNDTNESIFDFIYKQQNPITGYINHNFTFDRDYVTYFNWLLNGFTRYEKEKLDVFANKNTKYLFYRYNDYLHESKLKLKKIKHSSVRLYCYRRNSE